MIRLNNISVSFTNQTGNADTILANVTLEIARGDWVVLTGPNGSGKTTLLKALSGLVPLSAGSISSDEFSYGSPRFSLMLQDPDNQFVASSVWNELLLSAGRDGGVAGNSRTDGCDRLRAEESARAALDRFRLSEIAGRNPHHLSGGEQQRLAMATVWLERPDVLLLDEPVSFLDEEARIRCIEFVRELNANGTTIIWASPGGDELLPAKTIVYLERGVVRFAGSRDRFLIEARIFGGEHALPRLFRIGEALISALAAGNRTGGTCAPAADAASCGSEMLVLRDVSFSYRPGAPVLRSVNVVLSAGECLGVTGPNGSGKTTLLELAGKILKPDAGSIMLNPGNRPRIESGTSRSCLVDCFYLFQGPERIFFAETVYEEIAYGLRKSGTGRDACTDSVAQALSHVGFDIDAVRSRSPFRLSFGEMRRLALAVAISLKPGVLLLDEPSACLDEAGMSVLRSVLYRCRADGRAAVVASHDIDFLAETCDRLIFLEEGSVIDDLPIGGGTLPSSRSWFGRARPYVLVLQEALALEGTRFSRRALSRELFVRELLDNAECNAGEGKQ